MRLPSPRWLKIGQILGLGVVAACLPACLVPIPLEQETVPDGGMLLEVTGSNPAFGTQRVMGLLDQFNYQVDVVTDSPLIAGRLYVQLNGSCCDLDVSSNPPTARFLQQAEPRLISSGTGATSRYTIDFPQVVQPCNLGSSGSLSFIVPVLASGGFKDLPTGFRPDGLGITDRSHYWTVICP